MRIARLVADLVSAVPLQLPSDARWRAIQSCRNLADRLPSRATLGNRAPFFQTEMLICLSHRNTPDRRCCTSFVKSADPGPLDTRFRGCDEIESAFSDSPSAGLPD